jgi:hypothetical protein
MVTKLRLGDRREFLRFDVSGQLWGALDRCEQVMLRNISVAGALIEATLPSSLKSIRAAQMSVLDSGSHLNAVVRHISPVPGAPEPDRFLVGLEFVHMSPAARVELDRLVRDWQKRPGANPDRDRQ